MTDYRVSLEIDVAADSPEAAAIEARRRTANQEPDYPFEVDVSVRIAESGGIDNGPIFQRVAELAVLPAPSHPHYRAVPIVDATEYECGKCGRIHDEAEAEDGVCLQCGAVDQLFERGTS